MFFFSSLTSISKGSSDITASKKIGSLRSTTRLQRRRCFIKHARQRGVRGTMRGVRGMRGIAISLIFTFTLSFDATKFAYLINKNKSFARPSRAFFNFLHFFQVLGKSATWNDHFSNFTENVNTQAQIWIFFSSVDTAPLNSVPG